MRHLLLLGGGKIGRMIAQFLVSSGDYRVRIGDVDQLALGRLAERADIETAVVDATNREQLLAAMQGCEAVISALSFHHNPAVAEAALEAGVSYFDLTEDIETTRRVRKVAEQAAEGQIFMPQCGLAPGFVSIVAHHLTQNFDELDTVHMRVGALPQFPTNRLKYNLTWSTDGLINEYCNPCEAIHDGRRTDVLPFGPETAGKFGRLTPLRGKLDQFFAQCEAVAHDPALASRFGPGPGSQPRHRRETLQVLQRIVGQ